MTTDCRVRRLTRQYPCKQSVRVSARGLEPGPGEGRLHGQVPLDTIFRNVLTGQRTSDLKKVDGNGEGPDAPQTQATPDPETPDEVKAEAGPQTPEEPASQAKPPEPKTRKGLSRRQALTVLGIGAGALIAEQALVADGRAPAAGSGFAVSEAGSVPPEPGGYAPDGTAGRAAALPLDAVGLRDSPFRQNQARNTTYLLFLDPERMLRSFRLN